MHRDLPATIGDNLKNLLLTNKGERLMDYNFGANLKELCFELGTEEADAEAINRIRTAVGRYLPFVSLETFEPINETDINGELAKVGINITYKIPVVSQDARRVEVILYTVG